MRRPHLEQAGGAQFVSTDFADPTEIVSSDASQPFDPSYEVSLPDDLTARCNPISAQATCRSYVLERFVP